MTILGMYSTCKLPSVYSMYIYIDLSVCSPVDWRLLALPVSPALAPLPPAVTQWKTWHNSARCIQGTMSSMVCAGRCYASVQSKFLWCLVAPVIIFLGFSLDVQQSIIGSCNLDDVSVRVLTRVIGHCPHRNQLLIDCGWTGLRYDLQWLPIF